MNLNLLLTKLARAAFTLWLVVTLAFVVLHLSGDPIEALVGDQASQEVIDRYRAKFGFDRPLWEQYLTYFASIAGGDFGISLSDRTPTVELIAGALPRSEEHTSELQSLMRISYAV